jgi:glutamyl-tRNA synthetase
VDDQILIKSDGFPTYHFASVVDDHLMEISHVIRGEEWLPSIPKHLMLYEAFGWSPPRFAHLPLLLNHDRSKLSKRHGSVSIDDFRVEGFLPEALVNFVALLGWGPAGGTADETFTMAELVDEFTLEQVHAGGAVVDRMRLRHLNSQVGPQLV